MSKTKETENKGNAAKEKLSSAGDSFKAFSYDDQATLIAGVLVVLAAIIPGWLGMGIGILVGMLMIMCVVAGVKFSKVLEKMPWNQSAPEEKPKKKKTAKKK